MLRLFMAAMVVAGLGALAHSSSANAANDCTFTTSGGVMTLDADCTTDGTILVPQGMTLDGAGHTITAVDPAGGHFTGAVVQNAGNMASVTNLVVTAGGLANVCDGRADRLRGIMFEGASGSIMGNVVTGLNQGPSGCQEGNAIEVRNAPFDGTHPDTQTVEVSHNTITDYQKTGIVANGDVDVAVHHNVLGASATQENLAANGIQLGFGAMGSVTQNQVEGNQWKGTSDFAATAILIFEADGAEVSLNNISGNSDVGLLVVADDVTVDNNRVFDEGDDHVNSSADIGIFSGGDNTVTNNKVRGFDTAFEGDVADDNKEIPSP